MAERYQEAEDIFNEWDEDDRQREAEAKALGITMAELDAKEASLRPFFFNAPARHARGAPRPPRGSWLERVCAMIPVADSGGHRRPLEGVGEPEQVDAQAEGSTLGGGGAAKSGLGAGGAAKSSPHP